MMNIVVLGAGASRGASFAARVKKICKPPMNSDFFTQLQRVLSKKHDKYVKATINDVIKFFGVNWTITLEEYFTQIEFYRKVVPLTGERVITSGDLRKARANLMQALAAVLEESMFNEKCKFHTGLIEKLNPADTIISFNYDCLMDFSLVERGSGKWNPHYGYGFPLQKWKLSGEKKWQPKGELATKSETITLYKLHGSLHWQITNPSKAGAVGTIKLKERIYRQNENVLFTIIPPEWNKDAIENPVFLKIWKAAAQSLAKATSLIFIGYSFSPTDLYASALFRLALSKNKKVKQVVIVNPDKETRRRTRAIISNCLYGNAKLVQFDSFREYAKSGFIGL